MTDLTRVLVTTDFSGQALPGVERAAALARKLDAEVVLLHVVEDHLPPILMFATDLDRQEILERQRLQVDEMLIDYAARHLAECRVETVTRVGVAAKEIVRFAVEESMDLIVMASHGYGPVRQLLLGSTTERVLHHTACPVLVIPSSGEQSENQPASSQQEIDHGTQPNAA